jgi:hypothetical protein
MHPSGSCKCLCCGEFFRPDARNRGRQRYCVKPDCRKASKAASQRAWRGKPENADYFRGADQVARVQAWRKSHPGYWRKQKPEATDALQEISPTQGADAQQEAAPDDSVALRDLFRTQPPVVLGLIAHLTGSALQEDIAAMTRNLHSRGRAMLGIDVPRPEHAKTHPRSTTAAACAAAV